MKIEDLTPTEQHKKIVSEINKIYPNYFTKRTKHINSDEVHKKITYSDTCNLAALTSRIFNMHGASVGNIDLYQLFQAYFLDEEKRKEINKIIM